MLITIYIILFELCKEKLAVDKLPGAERVKLVNALPTREFHLSKKCLVFKLVLK